MVAHKCQSSYSEAHNTTIRCVVKSQHNNSHTEPHNTTNCCVAGFWEYWVVGILLCCGI